MNVRGQVKGRRHPVDNGPYTVFRDGCKRPVSVHDREGDAIAESIRLSRMEGCHFSVKNQGGCDGDTL